ncbi:hypothetical protein LSAT2_006601 [Lamellibrachia satsuma]|nr:hypothetical protein LSAT2_006601 [Lamellibrachia satsuma]
MMAPCKRQLKVTRHLICGSCSNWVDFVKSGCEKSLAEVQADSFSFECRGCTKMKELEVELEELRLLVVAMVGREQGGCASSSSGGTVDDKVGKDTRDARESSPQPGRELRGGKVIGRRETGLKETGRKGTRGKTTGVKERGVGEMGGKTTGVKERGVGETRAKEREVGEAGAKETGGKGSGQNVMEGIERKSYSTAVIEGVRKRARVFVGDSIVRKTDRVLNKGDDVVVCLLGAKIETITERLLAATVAFWLGGLTMLVIQQPGIGSMIGDMAMNIDPEDMAYNVREIMIHGGFEKIQDVLKENLMVESEPQKQKAYMLKILKLLDEHFISNMDLVEEMCKEIHKTYLNFPKKSEIPNCGDFPGNFYGQMDKSTMCQLVPAAARRDPSTTYVPRSVMLNLIHHYHMSNSKGQMYISTTDGILYLYPAVRLPDNAENPRFRPWYGDAVSQPKYILLAIDVSITVWPFFNVSKEVARIFINSSNPRDHITVIGYSANHFVTPRKMGFCFDRYKLAKATLPSQALLQKFIEALSINGSSHYETALEKIFSFINQPVDHGYKDHYVVLISGGPSNQTKAEVIQSIRSKMTSVSRLVKFVTIDLGSHKSDILKGIGDEFGTYISSDGVKLPYDYFQRFINAYIRNNKSLIMTPAFIDSITGDVVCSMPQPIFVEDRLVAVAATEVNLNKIFYEIKYLDSNAQSYMFLIDRFGLTAYHPHLPRLELFVPIGDIEKEAQEHGVIDSMLRGESGQKAFMVKDIISIGKHRMHGIETVLINTTFMWQSLRHTEFSICSVLGHIGNIMSSRYKIDRPVPAVPFIYHDDIIHNNGIHKCKYFRRAVTKDRSTVKFSGKAFQDPFKYLNDEESPIKTQLYKEVIKGHPRLNIFKEGVVESVNITSVVDKEWVDKAPYAIWRVLTTATGVTRIYPGITEKRYYLPVERSWYIHSTWKPGNTIVSSPYLKRWAGGFIITLSKALTTHMHSGDRSLVVFGALKIDVFAEYLYTVLLGSYPMCHSTWSHCFVVDETGYIVIHPDFIVPPNSPTTIPRIDQIHIIQKEPRIAEKLIKHRVMERVTCFELKHLALFHSYKGRLPMKFESFERVDVNFLRVPTLRQFASRTIRSAPNYQEESLQCKNRDIPEVLITVGHKHDTAVIPRLLDFLSQLRLSLVQLH